MTQRRRVNCSKTCHTRGWHQPPRVSQARSPSGCRGGPPALPPRPRPRTQPPAEPRLLARRPSCPRLSPPCPGGRLHQAPQTPARTAQPLPSSSSPAASPAAQGRVSLSTLRVMGVVARGGPGILQPVGNFRQRKGRLDEPLGTAGPRGVGGEAGPRVHPGGRAGPSSRPGPLLLPACTWRSAHHPVPDTDLSGPSIPACLHGLGQEMRFLVGPLAHNSALQNVSLACSDYQCWKGLRRSRRIPFSNF